MAPTSAMSEDFTEVLTAVINPVLAATVVVLPIPYGAFDSLEGIGTPLDTAVPDRGKWWMLWL